MTADSAKATGLMVAIFGGIFWWLFSGHELITENARFVAYLNSYRGHGIFSFQSAFLAIAVLSALLYPPVLWFWLCWALFDPRSVRQMCFSRGSLFAWFAPITFSLLIGFFLAVRVISTLAVWLLFAGSICFVAYAIVWTLFQDLWRKWRDRSGGRI